MDYTTVQVATALGYKPCKVLKYARKLYEFKPFKTKVFDDGRRRYLFSFEDIVEIKNLAEKHDNFKTCQSDSEGKIYIDVERMQSSYRKSTHCNIFNKRWFINRLEK